MYNEQQEKLKAMAANMGTANQCGDSPRMLLRDRVADRLRQCERQASKAHSLSRLLELLDKNPDVGAHSDFDGGNVKPSIGRIVLYTNLGDKDGKYPPEQQAAIITGVNEDGSVALKIFYKTGLFDMQSVPYSEGFERGHWSCPPRV